MNIEKYIDSNVELLKKFQLYWQDMNEKLPDIFPNDLSAQEFDWQFNCFVHYQDQDED